ncbi:MAG TPA: hypothetical protein VMM78_03050, partial [Thermomicrobiales bacterium]|nr:hypothetical protein [Thermomicrobiales bacterium]
MYLDALEAHLSAYLATFRPPADPDAIVALFTSERQSVNLDERRRQIDGELDRLKTLFRLGDVDETEYRRQRDELMRARDALQPAGDRSATLATMAAFLADLTSAWGAATPDERNRLARTMFERLTLKDNQIESVR